MRILVLCLRVPDKTVQELKHDPDLTLVMPDDTEIPERLATIRPDVVLLNVGHLTAVDQQHYQTVHHATAAPIVVLVEPDAAKAITLLGNSVADHLEFPATPSELRQRLRMVAERARQGLIRSHLPSVQIDDLIIDRQAHIVQRHGKPITLSAREWDVLEVLIQARGAPVSTEAIAVRIWGQSDDSERHTVKVTVGRLRLKIEPDPKTPRYIYTEMFLQLLRLSHLLLCQQLVKQFDQTPLALVAIPQIGHIAPPGIGEAVLYLYSPELAQKAGSYLIGRRTGLGNLNLDKRLPDCDGAFRIDLGYCVGHQALVDCTPDT